MPASFFSCYSASWTPLAYPFRQQATRGTLSVLRFAEQRLSLAPNGKVRFQLKTPYRDGTTHVSFEPLDCIARPAAAVRNRGAALTEALRQTANIARKLHRSNGAGAVGVPRPRIRMNRHRRNAEP